MARVRFNYEQRLLTDGVQEVEVEAPTVGHLIERLDEMFPDLGTLLERSAVSINGEVIPDATYERIPANADVLFVPRAQGG